MSDVLCPHCGQAHAPEVLFCPTTGRAVRAAGPGLPLPDGSRPPAPAASTAAQPPPPTPAPPPPTGAHVPGTEKGGSAETGDSHVPGTEKGVADILKEAYELYRRHARMLLTTCALLFVPAAIVNSCARAVILAPTVAAASTIGATATELEASGRALQDAYDRHADPGTIARLQAENARRLEELGRRGVEAAGAAMGSFALLLLGILGTLVTAFFLYGIVVPLTNGALTIAVADRVLGGAAGWREVWMLLFRRLGMLLSAVIPAAILIAIGSVFLLIPGLILGLLFAFVSPVVLIEGLRGRAALRRSAELVRSDWLRVAIVIFVFSVLCWLARMLAQLLIPGSAIFAGSLLGDLLTMVLLPVPILGLVLLYFDIRRKRENFTPDRLRSDLEALKSA